MTVDIDVEAWRLEMAAETLSAAEVRADVRSWAKSEVVIGLDERGLLAQAQLADQSIGGRE